MARGEEILNLYGLERKIMFFKEKGSCKFCDFTNTLKVILYPFEVKYNIDIDGYIPIKGIAIMKCSNCRFVAMYEYEHKNNIDNIEDEDMQKSIVFLGKISKKDFEGIQENIKNKINYEEVINIVKNFCSYYPIKVTKKCLYCNDTSLIDLFDGFEHYDKFKCSLVLVCENKKCKSFSVFKKNSETDFFDCLYHGKYNKLKDVLLENK